MCLGVTANKHGSCTGSKTFVEVVSKIMVLAATEGLDVHILVNRWFVNRLRRVVFDCDCQFREAAIVPMLV